MTQTPEMDREASASAELVARIRQRNTERWWQQNPSLAAADELKDRGLGKGMYKKPEWVPTKSNIKVVGAAKSLACAGRVEAPDDGDDDDDEDDDDDIDLMALLSKRKGQPAQQQCANSSSSSSSNNSMGTKKKAEDCIGGAKKRHHSQAAPPVAAATSLGRLWTARETIGPAKSGGYEYGY
jgi:hypothetical protein